MQDKYTPNWKKQQIFFRILIAVILVFAVAIYITKRDSKVNEKPELTTPPPAQNFEPQQKPPDVQPIEQAPTNDTPPPEGAQAPAQNPEQEKTSD